MKLLEIVTGPRFSSILEYDRQSLSVPSYSHSPKDFTATIYYPSCVDPRTKEGDDRRKGDNLGEGNECAVEEKVEEMMEVTVANVKTEKDVQPLLKLLRGDKYGIGGKDGKFFGLSFFLFQTRFYLESRSRVDVSQFCLTRLNVHTDPLKWLKKVRKVPRDVTTIKSPPSTVNEAQTETETEATNLQILLFPAVTFASLSASLRDTLLPHLSPVNPFTTLVIPSSPPLSHSLAKLYSQKYWPSSFLPGGLSDVVKREEKLELSKEEKEWKIKWCGEVMKGRNCGNLEKSKGVEMNEEVIIVDSRECSCCDEGGARCGGKKCGGSIVSRSSDELQALFPNGLKSNKSNPLITPTLLAIQGVARKERERLVSRSSCDSKDLGQYLCTDLDAYIGWGGEPDVFEAMALLHARIRSVTFLERGGRMKTSSLGGFKGEKGVHCMDNANHVSKWRFLVI